VVEPELRGEPKALPDITLNELAEIYLDGTPRPCARRRSSVTLGGRLRYATDAFGTSS
jgi:hypothetical protein